MSTLNTNRILQIDGAILDKHQLEKHLENIAITHNLKEKSDKNTYPIPILKQNYQFILETYNLLNKHLKLGIKKWGGPREMVFGTGNGKMDAFCHG